MGFGLTSSTLLVTLGASAAVASAAVHFAEIGTTLASGGGGWGPIVTPTLISTTSTEPRKVIGTVSAAEFVVAVAASVGFLAQIGRIDIDWAIVGGLALGGTIAAPFAAKLVGILPAKQLGIVVAVAIIVLNAVAIIRA